MTRMSTVCALVIPFVLGCTSDPMGLRSPYRSSIVPPSTNTAQPVSRPPIALQPGVQPAATSQTMILPGATISNAAAARDWRTGGVSPYPMFASAGGNIDGRAYGGLTREASLPAAGGARTRKHAMRNTALANGITASPQEDLRYRGGHTIKDLKYMNVYVGGSDAWDPNDWKNIDKSLAAAMSDQRLNNVVMQYFGNQQVSAQFLGSFFMSGWKPKMVQKNDLENQVQNLYRGGAFNGRDLPNTVVNFMLPRGTILGDPSGGQQHAVLNKAIPQEEAEDSTGGLGGYHGSAHIDGKTIYYAVGVYSERLANGGTNGIPVFPNANWKNVVATFYHELHEARTDADVDDADTGGASILGWTSDSGQEIGDYPIAEAKQLAQVFQEVPLTDGSGTVPVQFNYSNAVHGPEGPIDYPHGMEPSNNPNPRPPTNPPNNPQTQPGGSNGLPPEVMRMISNWDQLEDYVKKAILKLLS